MINPRIILNVRTSKVSDSTYTVMRLAWNRFGAMVCPSYLKDEDIFDYHNSFLRLFPPRPPYAWVMMKALLLLKMDLKDNAWICDDKTLQKAIEETQALIDLGEKNEHET